jgi:hypothetical protein
VPAYIVQPVISDTGMQIGLNDKVLPKGDKFLLKITYVSEYPLTGRSYGRLYTKRGVVYDSAMVSAYVCI